jgi:hypothetical protein
MKAYLEIDAPESCARCRFLKPSFDCVPAECRASDDYIEIDLDENARNEDCPLDIREPDILRLGADKAIYLNKKQQPEGVKINIEPITKKIFIECDGNYRGYIVNSYTVGLKATIEVLTDEFYL